MSELVGQLSSQMMSAGLGGAPKVAAAPPMVQQQLLFPYMSGLQFVAFLRRSGKWAAVDKAWRSPPVSSEQILHPEKYVAHELPVPVTPSAMAPLGDEIHRTVLGELLWRVLFETAVDNVEAERAAAGWGGDRAVAYAIGDGKPTVVILSTWDTEMDAKEAENALLQVAAKLSGTKPSPGPGSDTGQVRIDRAGDAFIVQRHDQTLLLVAGVKAELGGETTAAIWKNWKVGAAKP